MQEKTFELYIMGYWHDKNIICLPQQKGVFFVYETKYDKKKDALFFKRLLYIGETEDVKDGILKHKKYSEWLKYIKYGNELCYSMTCVENSYRERIAAAYIYIHKPPANEEYTDKFPFDKTRIRTAGDIELLNKDFTIDKTVKTLSNIKSFFNTKQ